MADWQLRKPDNKRYIFLTMAAGGLIAFVYGGYVFWQSSRLSHWPTTKGRVTEAVVRPTPGNPDNVRVRIAFAYSVDQVEYHSDQYRLGADKMGMNLSEAKERVAPYQAGSPVTVWYDPDDPADAVLEPGADHYGYTFCGVGVLMGVFGWAYYRVPILLRILRLFGHVGH